MESIYSIPELNTAEDLKNGISIKLSALYSKYDALHSKNVYKFLLPKVKDLVVEALRKDVAVTIDAEEQDRLSLSLNLIESLALDPANRIMARTWVGSSGVWQKIPWCG